MPGAPDICKGPISYHFDMRCPPFKKNIVMTKQEIKNGLSTGKDLRCKPYSLMVAQVDYQNTNDRVSRVRFEGKRDFRNVVNCFLYFIKPE